MPLPRICLVTPSFNQAQYLEETITSVLSQNYPNLQYGVIDAGSTDGSIGVIEKYRPQLSYAVIEPDRGQSDAINKGLRRADAQILGWLCSDDTLLPNSLQSVGEYFHNHPQIDWLSAPARVIDFDGRRIDQIIPTGDFSLPGALLRDEHFCIPQPATFWRKSLSDSTGLLDPALHYCMDFDLWLRFLASGSRPAILDTPLATYRRHPESKTCSQADGFIETLITLEKRYAHLLPWSRRVRLRKKIGYQKRALAIRRSQGRLWKQVLTHPWWLGSQQVRSALKYHQPLSHAA